MTNSEYNKLSKDEQKKVPFKELPTRMKFFMFSVVASIAVIITFFIFSPSK